jgi:hypothetical protein
VSFRTTRRRKMFEGYLQLNSNVPIAAWERIETPLSRKLLRGRTEEEIHSTTLAIIPHFAVGGAYESIVNLVNPTGGLLILNLTATDDQGNTIGTAAQVTLASGQVQRSFVGDLFQILNRPSPSTVTSGYIRIREVQGGSFQITGDIEIFTFALSTRGASMFYPISDAAATSWTVPFASNSNTYFTGYAVANPNELLAVQTDVQVEVIDSAGIVVDTRLISLPPRGRHAAVIAPAIQNGYLRFTSNLPIHVLGAIGTTDGRLLDQLPALP